MCVFDKGEKEKVKVAILTFSTAQNYGAQLQAFGLQYALRKIEIDAYHIRIREQKQSVNIRSLLRDFLSKKQRDCYCRFQNENLDFIDGIYDINNIENLNGLFGAFITGSDQVFNMKNGVDSIYFQEFVNENLKKLSYAASMGIREVPAQYQNRVRKDLDCFDAISVREQDAAEELAKFTKNSIVRNIDPVFLPTRNEWDKIAVEPKYGKPYIFVYGTEMTSEFINIAQRLKAETGYKIFSVFPMKGAEALYLKIGPAEFIGYIKNAAYVVTTSFHCTAFSMIYEKNLIEFLHSTTGSRARGLLELLDKTECIYTGESYELTKKVEYDNTCRLIEKERNSGYEFLRKNLE